MARDSKAVAAELIDLVVRSYQDPERCRSLLAVRLEVIYDYAYAMGYTTGKRFAKDYAYDLGLAEGLKKATENLGGTHQKALMAPQSSDPPKQQPAMYGAKPGPRVLYHLPCSVCGALYSEDECPVCKARATAN
ncbi:MAG: hypothetical protein JO187_12195 [Acidobacteria bacterium]|nr:hypothetical protein [Acidobacteriaceae bacterium]MBV9610310.1 hypothetical protein [Acidobacteriota bacterium]